MKKILLLMAFMILFTTMPLAQDYVSKPPWIVDQNMYIKGMVWVDSNLVPSRACHWYLGVDSLRWNAYMCTLWCNVAMFDQLGFNCADTGKIDTSFFKDIWVDTLHSCSSVLVIDNDTTFFDGNTNDAKIVQFCELLDAANTENAFLCSTLTDAGSNANIRRAFKAILVDGGFTGNNQTYAGYFYNSAGGTGAVARNYGVLGYAVYASATGNYGLKGVSENASVNVGVYGQSIDDVAAADNFGLLGIASNDGAGGFHCAGYFDLGDGTLPNLTFSSTIIGDNHNYTDNHLTLMDDLYNVFVVADYGDSAGIVYVMDQTDTTTLRPTAVVSDSAMIGVLYVDTTIYYKTYSFIGHNGTTTNFLGVGAGANTASSNFFGDSSGYNNTGIRVDGYGYQTLYGNTGTDACAFGYRALHSNTGTQTCAFGVDALNGNTGANCCAFGFDALNDNTGADCCAFGYNALNGNTGTKNTAIGSQAFNGLAGLTNSTAIGYDAEPEVSNQVMLGDANVTQVKTAGTFIGAQAWIITGTDTTKIRGTAVESDSGIFGVITATTLVIDSIDAQHGVFDISLWADSIYCNHLVNNVSAIFNAYLDADSVHGDHIVSDAQVVGDSLYGDHVVANVELIADSINADHGVFNVNLVGTSDAGEIQWDGYQWFLDYDSDDSLAFICFDATEGDTLRSDTINHILTWTGAGGFLGMDVAGGADTFRLWDDGTDFHIDSDNQAWFNNNVWISGADSLFFTDASGADTSWINQDGVQLSIQTDNKIVLGVGGSADLTITAASIEVDGYLEVQSEKILLGADNDDSLVIFEFGSTDSIVWDSIPEDLYITCGFWLPETLFFTDGRGGADSSWIVQDGTNLNFFTDNTFNFQQTAEFNAHIQGTIDAGELQWDGFEWFLDFDSDDSLAIICFDAAEGDTLRSDTITHILTWTGAGGFLGMDVPAGADTFRLYDDGDTCHWSSDNPHKISANTVVQGNFTIRGTIASTSITRGQATFTRNTIVDTVPGVTGVSTNSIITVTGKMGAALNSGLTWSYLNTDSILVHILEDDTTGQAVTYCWTRME